MNPDVNQDNKQKPATEQTLEKAQKAFEGVAEQLNVHDEDDVQALVNEVRYGEQP